MSSPDVAALELRGLRKVFTRPAVDGLDLTVRAGELYALLGPNGAGKTTTLRMVAGLTQPTAGSIRVFGVDAKTARKRAQELLEWLALWEHRGERCEGFSRGMKQKAALAGALIHEPRLLMLDEPLTGLDAAMARQVKDVLQEKVRTGATVILTTHILDVAERMADRIGIIQHGRLLAEGSLAELSTRAGRQGGTLEDVFLDLTSAPVPA